MGEVQYIEWKPGLNRSVKVSVDDQRNSSHGRVLLLRDIDHEINVTESMMSGMSDPRFSDCIRYIFVEPYRQFSD